MFSISLVQAIRQCCCSGLVNDAQDIESSDLAGFLCCLTLRVIEVRGHRDDCVADGFTEVCLGIALELLQNARADFLRRVSLAINVSGLPRGAHVALDRTNRAVHVGDGLALGDFTHEHFAILGERDDGRGGARSFGVSDNGGFATFKYGHHRVGGS